MVEPDDKQPTPRGRLHKCASWAGRSILSAVLLSIAAAIGTVPITACYFNYLSLVSIPANAMVALLVVALTIFGMLSIGLGWIPLLGAVAVVGTKAVSGWMLSIVTWMGGLPWASCSMRSPAWGFMLFYYAVVIATLEYTHRAIRSERKSPHDKIRQSSSK